MIPTPPPGSIIRNQSKDGVDYYVVLPDVSGPSDWVSLLHVKGPKLAEGQVKVCTRGRIFGVVGKDFTVDDSLEYRMIAAGGQLRGALMPRIK